MKKYNQLQKYCFFKRKISLLIISLLTLIIFSCGSTNVTGTTAQIPVTTPVTIINNATVNPNWITNNTTYSANITNSGNVLEDVQRVFTVELSGVQYQLMIATGVPKYDFNIRQSDLDQVRNRPDYSSSGFRDQTKFTALTAGTVVKFGQNLGYNNVNNSGTCGSIVGASGNGYWPPGPGCATDQSHSNLFPATPTVASTGSQFQTTLGKMGSFVNGVSVYDWQDGSSYNTVWVYSAAHKEVYDLDICEGHPASGDYHHHFYSPCLGARLNDDGTAHSPIHGYAADGYPIHGPWHASGVLVKSSWRERVYSTNRNYPDFGCGTAGKRTCLIADPYNGATSSFTPASSAGPDTNTTYQSLSGHTLRAISGTFFQDYYYDANMFTNGTLSLDVHGGHEHTGVTDYHYHLPLKDAVSEAPAFPFTIGPRLKGTVVSTHWGTSGGGQPPRGKPPRP